MLRVYVSDSTDPYQNLAAEELLLQALRPNDVVLYLWQNHDTIVIGRNQNPWRECRVEDFEAAGGRLARRLSGGGAVYHDGGNQNFTFLAMDPLYDVAKHTEVIRRAAARFGVDAVRSGRNDILAGGRKFSGNAFYKTGEKRYHHGTILIDSDMARLAAFLAPSKQKLAEKGVESVRARVVNLRRLAPALSPQAMRTALAEEFEAVYAAPAVYCSLAGDLPAPLWQQRTQAYAAAEWRLGRRLPKARVLAGRLAFGEVELHLQIQRGRVQAAAVYTDALDESWAAPLEAALAGCEASAGALAGCIAANVGNQDIGTALAAFVRGARP